MKFLSILIITAGVFFFGARRPSTAVIDETRIEVQLDRTTSGSKVVRRGLTHFNRQIIDTHKQLYGMSCIPSSAEMVLKLLGRVPVSYYDLQTQWKNKSDGSFKDFDGKTVAGVTFHQQFVLARDENYPLAKLFETIHSELVAGRFVIVGLAVSEDWHEWVIYDEDLAGEFLAVSKGAGGTTDECHVKRLITQTKGTDIGTYQLQVYEPTKD